FLSTGFPPTKLVKVEALRYLGLAELAAPRPERHRTSRGEDAQVLVLGEIAPASMRQLLLLLEHAMGLLPKDFRFTFKPHPSYAVDLTHYPGFVAAQTQEPLSALLDRYDIVVASNSTSAAVDAFVAGLPVIIGVGGHSLNLSPLRGQAEVTFVSN